MEMFTVSDDSVFVSTRKTIRSLRNTGFTGSITVIFQNLDDVNIAWCEQNNIRLIRIDRRVNKKQLKFFVFDHARTFVFAESHTLFRNTIDSTSRFSARRISDRVLMDLFKVSDAEQYTYLEQRFDVLRPVFDSRVFMVNRHKITSRMLFDQYSNIDKIARYPDDSVLNLAFPLWSPLDSSEIASPEVSFSWFKRYRGLPMIVHFSSEESIMMSKYRDEWVSLTDS